MLRKLVYVLICLVPLSLVIGACSSAESTRSNAGGSGSDVDRSASGLRRGAGPPSDVVSQLIQEALKSDGSVSYKTLVERLGPPQDVQTEPIANQYVRGQIDTLRTLVYSGIKALVYDVANDPKTFLVRLSLSGSQYSTPDGLRVGLKEQRVLDTLGPPTRRNAATGELIYQESEPTPTSMVIHVRDGRVEQIDWEFYFA